MIRFEMNETVNRPVEQVFERLVNISDYSKWLPKSGVFNRTEQTSPGPVGKGATFYDKGMMGTFIGEVSEFKRPTQVAFKETLRWLGMKVMEARPGYVLEAAGGGTIVHHKSEGQLYGLFKLMQPMVAVLGSGERKRIMATLKKSLELSK